MFHLDLVWRLEALALGIREETLFWGLRATIPVHPADHPITSIVPTGGTNPIRTHNDLGQISYQRPSAQVIVRCRSLDAAMSRALVVAAGLCIANELLNATFYQSVVPTQEPFDFGPDDKGRARVAFNVNAMKNP